MRVIGGRLKGRNFQSPHGNRTHPMSEKMRGAIFNALGAIGGLTVLDAYSGSGAIAFEAISRGALSITAIDNDKNAITAIRLNAQQLGIAGQMKTVQAGISSWLKTNANARFNMVVCDPPYDAVNMETIQEIATRLSPDGILVLSLPPEAGQPNLSDFTLLSQKNYGDGTLAFYRRIK